MAIINIRDDDFMIIIVSVEKYYHYHIIIHITNNSNNNNNNAISQFYLYPNPFLVRIPPNNCKILIPTGVEQAINV